jgi:hypothetical protein
MTNIKKRKKLENSIDAKFFGIDMPDEVTMIEQDRAYTSPIWYTP